MQRKGSRRQKKCKRCGKNIEYWNKSILCNFCYQYEANKKRRAKLILEHKCLRCGKKVDEIEGKFFVRCLDCKQKEKEYYQKTKDEQNETKSIQKAETM